MTTVIRKCFCQVVTAALLALLAWPAAALTPIGIMITRPFHRKLPFVWVLVISQLPLLAACTGGGGGGGGGGSSPAVASATVTPTSGPVPLTVIMDGSASTGSIISYNWVVGGASISSIVTYSQAVVTHTFDQPGRYDILFSLTDPSVTPSSANMQRFTVEVAPSPLAANNAMHFTQCTTFGDDSLLVDPSLANNSGETLFTRSHTVGSPSYHIAHTRQLADGSPVTMDYMRHDPNGIIKGILVLIAGGGLNAAIEGAEDTSAVSHSGGDFLVRSAHRFALHGYRVLTIDRPSDFAVYGDIDQLGYLYDEYRMGPDHMVDIATVISRENSENLPVMIVGTSRGAISAVRLNELVSGIALASPVTSANIGTTAAWIGSLELPVSSIQREAHLLFHQSDLCTVTEPNGTRTPFHDLDDLGKVVNADGVAGGFQDSVHSDVCGSFDLHAYNGIENCAVEKIVTRLNSLAERLNTDSNAAPATSNGEYPEGAVIDLSQLAFDPDGDSMNYHAPSISTMGSTVEVDPQTGVVRYIPRTHIAAGVEDVFVYTVTDHKGGVSTAVIRVNYR